jgi:hypothetical protein
VKTAVFLTLPLRLLSEANTRDGWRAKAKRTKDQRRVTGMATRARLVAAWPDRPCTRAYRDRAEQKKVTFALTVTLTRLGPRTLDTDNLARACKAVRDGVADALGVNDGDSRIAWRYEQVKGSAYAVEIRIEELT